MGGVRMETLHDLAPVLFAFLACGGFAVIYNIHGPGILICAFGGALGWLSYLLSAPILQSDISQTLVAAIVISAYSECMARVRKCPVTGYLLVAIFPWSPVAASTTPWSTLSTVKTPSSFPPSFTPWGWRVLWR